MSTSDRVVFTCDGAPVDVLVPSGSSLLDLLREQVGVRSVKDGCAPQGQCGCCTVLVDGEPRVACVTPATRIAGRSVTTVDGLPTAMRDRLAACFTSTGGSQCGFCTPGIVVRAAWLLGRDRVAPVDLDRALAAHLCRCTGWLSVREAIAEAAAGAVAPGGSASSRDLDAAGRRASLEGGVVQRVAPGVPLGDGGFADDLAPSDALVAVPLPPGSAAESVSAAGRSWVVGTSLVAARAAAGKVQGRRTTEAARPPLELPPLPAGGVRLATSWVEPAYLEPDASWCTPGGEPASPLANGGAFGAKLTSVAPAAARELADRLGRSVRVVFAREDVVRLGPKRPPIAASAVLDGRRLSIAGSMVAVPERDDARLAASSPYDVDLRVDWEPVSVAGPAVSPRLRAWPLAEVTVLVEGALAEARVDRAALVRGDRAGGVLLDTCALDPTSDAAAGARVVVDAGTGNVRGVEVRVAAGDPLDGTVLRSYCVGAAHMALGWVLSESLTVDPDTGDVLDLTIRSFGILRAMDTPPIEVTVLDDPGPPRQASDAVFAAVAAATWNAVAAATGVRSESLPVSGAAA
jgi:aerobic-type carbon monoxide dehydrogenase small subunit (CoxS/CutS family)